MYCRIHLAFVSLFFQPISKGGSIKEEIWALFFLGFFLIPFFHKKLRLYQGESQSFLICLLWFDFFLSFSTYITSTIFKSLCTKYWCLSYLFYIYCRFFLVCYYRALPIFFEIHLKRWLNNENFILPNKICKNFLISNASLILALDHQKQRVIREYYNIYGPWLHLWTGSIFVL